jgi:hypothetical protein
VGQLSEALSEVYSQPPAIRRVQKISGHLPKDDVNACASIGPSHLPLRRNSHWGSCIHVATSESKLDAKSLCVNCTQIYESIAQSRNRSRSRFPIARRQWAPATHSSVVDVENALKHHDASIPQWIECCDTTPVESTLDARPSARTGQLQFGKRTRTQPRVRFDQRGATRDVDDGDVLPGPQDRA